MYNHPELTVESLEYLYEQAQQDLESIMKEIAA